VSTPSPAISGTVNCCGTDAVVAVMLSDEQLAVLADRCAEHFANLVRADLSRRRFVNPAELAAVLGVERETIYRHAEQLGGVQLGGPGGRWRFDLDRALPAATAFYPRKGSSPAETAVAAGRSRPRGREVKAARRDLLPIRGPRGLDFDGHEPG
jgi:hypothetical protein